MNEKFESHALRISSAVVFLLVQAWCTLEQKTYLRHRKIKYHRLYGPYVFQQWVGLSLYAKQFIFRQAPSAEMIKFDPESYETWKTHSEVLFLSLNLIKISPNYANADQENCCAVKWWMRTSTKDSSVQTITLVCVLSNSRRNRSRSLFQGGKHFIVHLDLFLKTSFVWKKWFYSRRKVDAQVSTVYSFNLHNDLLAEHDCLRFIAILLVIPH